MNGCKPSGFPIVGIIDIFVVVELLGNYSSVEVTIPEGNFSTLIREGIKPCAAAVFVTDRLVQGIGLAAEPTVGVVIILGEVASPILNLAKFDEKLAGYVVIRIPILLRSGIWVGHQGGPVQMIISVDFGITVGIGYLGWPQEMVPEIDCIDSDPGA